MLVPLKTAMISVSVLDISVGLALLTGFFVWPAALAGSLHLIIVMTVSGINAITVRDVGLLAATIAIFVNSFHFPFIKK